MTAVTGIPTGIAYQPPAGVPGSAVDWPLEAHRSLLLVHDMQDHFIDKYEREAEPIRGVITRIRRLIEAARAHGVPVVFSAQPGDQDPEERALLSDFWGPGPAAGATGIIPELGAPGDGELMRKWRYSAFQRTDLAARLEAESRDTLVIVGVYANIGIKATALEAFMSDRRAFVVADAIADFDADEHLQALGWVARRCGTVLDAEAAERAWVSGAVPADDAAAEAAGESPSPAEAVAIREAAAVLGVPEDAIRPETDLVDAGLDSVRGMELADRLLAAGVEVPFERLFERPAIRRWGLR